MNSTSEWWYSEAVKTMAKARGILAAADTEAPAEPLMEQQPQQFVTVRIAVAVDPQGRWNARSYGSRRNKVHTSCFDWMQITSGLAPGQGRHFLVARLPIPSPMPMQAMVVPVPAT